MNKKVIIPTSFCIVAIALGAFAFTSEFEIEPKTTDLRSTQDSDRLVVPDHVAYTEEDMENDLSKIDKRYDYLTTVIDGYTEITYFQDEWQDDEDSPVTTIHEIILTNEPLYAGILATEFEFDMDAIMITIGDKNTWTYEELVSSTADKKTPFFVGDNIQGVWTPMSETSEFAHVEYLDKDSLVYFGGKLTNEQVEKLALAISAKP